MKRHFAIAATLLLLPGCGLLGPARPPRVEAPAMELRTSYRPGGVLLAATPAEPAAAALAVTVEGFALQRLPESLGEPVVSRAALITGPRNRPIAATPSPAELLRILPADTDATSADADLGSVIPIRTETVLVPAGCSAAIELWTATEANPQPLVRFLIAAPTQTAPQTPALPQLAISARADEPDLLTAQDPAGETQTLLIPWPLPEPAGHFTLAAPPLPDRGVAWPTAWRFTVELLPEGSEAAAQAAAIAAELGSPAPSSAISTFHTALAAELRDTADPARLRSAIAMLSLEVGAEVASETSVLLPDESVPILARAIAEALEQAPPDAPPTSLAWRLDRAALLAAATLHSAGRLGPHAGAMLSARFGEVGRDPASLAALAKASSNSADFRSRLIAEHIVLLEDVSPAARVRAYDWLTAAGNAPPEYDPLAPLRQRRRAIEHFFRPPAAEPAADQPTPVQPASDPS